jgi:hypothetical protein
MHAGCRFAGFLDVLPAYLFGCQALGQGLIQIKKMGHPVSVICEGLPVGIIYNGKNQYPSYYP